MTLTFPTPLLGAPPLRLARGLVRRAHAALAEPRRLANAELLRAFESIGDNCEFASLQKDWGVDQQGLFKWTRTEPTRLAASLDEDLAGVDDAANLELLVHSNNPDYILQHNLYDTHWHSFTAVGSESPERVLQRQHRRFVMLRRKFLEDVRAGHRIYVFRSLRQVAEADVQALNAALMRKGANRLLWVRQAADPATVGRAWRGDNELLMADIDVLAAYDQGMSHPSRLWLPILQKARRLAEFETLSRAA